MAKNESKTKYLELPCRFEWAKVFPENMDRTGPNNSWADHGGAYTVDVILTKDVFQQLEAAGSQKKPLVLVDGKWQGLNQLGKKDFNDAFEEADEVKIKLKRNHSSPFPQYGGPPPVGHADGTYWSLQDDGLIGNGSEGIVYVSVYETGSYTGTRLDRMQILHHVEYESDYDPEAGPRGFPNREEKRPSPKSTKKTSAKAPAPSREELDDEIPF